MQYAEQEESEILSEYKVASRDKHSKKRERETLTKYLALLLFVCLLFYCNPARTAQNDNMNWSHYYHKAGLANLYRAHSIADTLQNDNFRYEVQAHILNSINNISYYNKTNKTIIKQLKYQLILTINRHDHYPKEMKDIILYVDASQKCFDIYDSR